ncbi:MAG: tetratricopeptide repeat protein [Planctomycetes bacterium]|nr:tetratricopeptide repeat protein [Planctomycetota bacterium]
MNAAYRVLCAAVLLGYAPWLLSQEKEKGDQPAERRIVIRDGKGIVEGAGGRDGRRFPRVFGRGARTVVKPNQANVVDRARFDTAELLVQQGEAAEAIDVLRKVVEASPDATAVSAAHLSIGNILRQQINDIKGAVAAYKEVAPPYDQLAENYIVATYRDTGEPLMALKVLEDVLKTAETPQRKARLLELIARLYQEQGEIDLAIETYRRIPTAITYDEAMAMRGRNGALGQRFRMDLIRQKLR